VILLSSLNAAEPNAIAELYLQLHRQPRSAWSHENIPQRIDAVDVSRVLAARERRIAELEAEVSRLRTAANSEPS
jgi:hypothetical protein